MMKRKVIKILALSLALSVTSIGFVFAETAENLDEPVSIQITAVDDAVYEAQAEIDKLLFEQNYAGDLSEKGIFVTHTSTVDGYVEVGITPYTPENADAVIKTLGKDNVRVVEGIQAVTLEYNPDSPDSIDPAELADDSQIITVTGEADDINAPAEEDVVEDAKIISAPVEEVENNSISTFTILGLSALVLAGGIMLLKKKRA
ncbi:MAG TPA: LPXTG cell wall anchor domain-containing protein [Sedimentibacter sp.]|jgi:LPXTG-motif cell wall-anchored protein|nr:LPXTG cell wall anchor domain-containing protein [Sedimentibacter sp.]HNZ82192.1 LPXTG cell wall anchor domain-containing protein [Sedimentibacter sp.]HOH70017.1 LPXTG cell wall anchor domain-containing protein [Sedimentibacter sp.]